MLQAAARALMRAVVADAIASYVHLAYLKAGKCTDSDALKVGCSCLLQSPCLRFSELRTRLHKAMHQTTVHLMWQTLKAEGSLPVCLEHAFFCTLWSGAWTCCRRTQVVW